MRPSYICSECQKETDNEQREQIKEEIRRKYPEIFTRKHPNWFIQNGAFVCFVILVGSVVCFGSTSDIQDFSTRDSVAAGIAILATAMMMWIIKKRETWREEKNKDFTKSHPEEGEYFQ
jgi:amino acid transporter